MKYQAELKKEMEKSLEKQRINKKFEYLNNILKKVKVEETDRSTSSRQILEFDLTLKGYGHSFTVEEYLEIMKQDTIDVWQGHNDSTYRNYETRYDCCLAGA